MVEQKWYDPKIVGSALIVLLVGAIIFYGIPLVQQQLAMRRPPVAAPAYLYTEDLTVYFRVIDDTSGSFLTSGVRPSFYASDVNPFGYTFTGTSINSAVYESLRMRWITVLDAGSYVAVVVDTSGSPTLYPTKTPVSVSGTNETSMEVPLSPNTLHMVQRATLTVSTSIYAYNPSTGVYDTPDDEIDVAAYDRWQLDFRISVAGLNRIIKGGRFYLTPYTGLTVSSAVLDGATVPVYTDLDSSDDGQVGNYIVFPDWSAGTHLLTVYLTQTGTPSAGTYTLKIFEYYDCLLPSLRWWTDVTEDVTVTVT